VIRNPIVIDIAAAVLIAALVLIIEPGVSFGVVLGLLLLVICGGTLLLDRRRGRRTTGVRPRRR
jgi:hypothetical protein